MSANVFIDVNTFNNLISFLSTDFLDFGRCSQNRYLYEQRIPNGSINLGATSSTTGFAVCIQDHKTATSSFENSVYFSTSGEKATYATLYSINTYYGTFFPGTKRTVNPDGTSTEWSVTDK